MKPPYDEFEQRWGSKEFGKQQKSVLTPNQHLTCYSIFVILLNNSHLLNPKLLASILPLFTSKTASGQSS